MFGSPTASAQANYEHRNGYTAQVVRVPVSHGDTATGYLLIPDSVVQAPAVVVLHDHGAHFSIGKEKMVCPIPRTDTGSATNEQVLQDARRWVNKYYDGMFAGDSLAKAGYVVLAIDAVYWGERQKTAVPSDSARVHPKAYQPAYYRCHLQQFGEAWFETILRDDRACVDYLCRLSCVDTARIGVFGFSMGAFRAWQLAACDSRIKVCVASNWMTTKADHLGSTLLPSEANPSAYSMYRPDCMDDYPETASQIAPRPFLLLYGEYDHLFTPDSVQASIHTIQTTYHRVQQNNNFLPISLPFKHYFSRQHWQETRHFFDTHL
ncbi:MAG: dienelactone hydrolase family protein [Paludibacteraceae bacterium]